MGVPAFFRWLTKKYKRTISPCIEVEGEFVDGVEIPPNYSDPNPNGELDNLYLDMNAIVHPCSHPEGRPAPETEEEMMLEVFKYTNKVLNIARPRKLLMIAVDGVAPRAKMNQQRSRRFRSAKDAELQQLEKERQMAQMEAMGKHIDEAVKGKQAFDSNSITPGTPFMDTLAAALKYWVAYKLSSDPGWAKLQVIISDATVPGEGEHKIMNFIRSQRTDPEYDPNVTHCIHGLDADLIFLSLATHEPHFRVLREDVFNEDIKKATPQQLLRMTPEEQERYKNQKQPFIWLHINILREYLEHELAIPRCPFHYDFERAIDDWVFMCFFAGNDFLPHLPSLDVRDNSIKILSAAWKRVLPKMGGFITRDGHMNMKHVEELLKEVGKREPEMIREKQVQALKQEERNAKRNGSAPPRKVQTKGIELVRRGGHATPVMNMSLTSLKSGSKSGMSNSEIVQNLTALSKANTAKVDLQDVLDAENASGESTPTTSTENPDEIPIDIGEPNEKKRKLDDDEQEEAMHLSKSEMWSPGYYKRYYSTKMNANTPEEQSAVARKMVECYIEGISWVLLYYYQGCPSWNWYYPYHYAPFAQDFQNLESIKIEFTKGTPFQPYEQLMSVLPAASNRSLPAVFKPLMTEPTSDIIDFYPTDFKIDMNGENQAWRGIALLPFIDEKRLLKAVRGKYSELTEAETDRNTHKSEVLFVGKKHPLFKKFSKLYAKEADTNEVYFNYSRGGLAGTATSFEKYSPDVEYKYPLGKTNKDYNHLHTSNFVIVKYQMPAKLPGKSMILTGYRSHQRLLTPEDIAKSNDTREQNGYGGFRRNQQLDVFDPSINYALHTGPGKGVKSFTPRVGCYEFFTSAFENEINQRAYQNNMSQGQNQFHQMHQQGDYQDGPQFSQGGQRGRGGYRGGSRGGYRGGRGRGHY